MAKKQRVKSPAPYKSTAQIDVQEDGRYSARAPRHQGDFSDMDRHPTISLARRIVSALAIREPWVVEGDDTDYCRFVSEQLHRHKVKLVRSAFAGLFKSGWRAFELRYGTVRVETGQLRQSIDGVKALRPQFVEQVVSEATGEFLGLSYRHGYGVDVTRRFIDSSHALFVNNDEDGFGDYGIAIYESAWRPWRKWLASDDGAERYDEKVAGGFRVVKFPVGKTPYARNNGEETDNSDIAEDILKRLRSSGDAKIPVNVIDAVTGTELPKILDAWKIEHIAAAGGLQPSFVIRGKYLDALMMRAFGLPERSATEGTLGTKAEAEAHADIAMLVNHDRHEMITTPINEFILPAYNDANVGDPDACSLVIGELDPDSRQLFTQIFTAMMSDPVTGDDVARRVDVEALLEKLQVPVRSPEEVLSDSLEQAAPAQAAPAPGSPSLNGTPQLDTGRF